ncbi:MAG: ABC transporter permease [Alphaproteobacteria bacterium]|nr:ABC transporter permease [Alphaproteobacteria bacterium]
MDFLDAFAAALGLIANFDRDLGEIVGLSLMVNLSAVAVSSAIGLPLGAAVALADFPGRRVAAVILNAFMGLPPVVVGLVVFLLLSRSGPFGVLGLLFTPTAMIIAQTILVTPIIAALTRQLVEDLWDEYGEHMRSMRATTRQSILTLLSDARYSLLTVVLAGFGRASAEVGAVMIVGGNIDHATRVMTTAIALETSKGNLSLALGLGIVLLVLTMGVNALAYAVRETARRNAAFA